MTINVISDLHCRSTSFPESFDPDGLASADVLVVAGDIGTAQTCDKMLKKLKRDTEGKFGSVIFVKGNHDYYVTDEAWGRKHSPKNPDYSGVTVDEVGDVTFIASTMWSPISVKNSLQVSASLNDYIYIPEFTTATSTRAFWKNLDLIEEANRNARESGRKVVIVTHHLPIPELIDEEYEGNDCNEAFCVLDKGAVERTRALRPDLWIHGHSHKFMDATVDGVRYVRNPYGYEWKTHSCICGSYREKTGFSTDFVVEV